MRNRNNGELPVLEYSVSVATGMDIDNVFARIGDFGWSQKKIFYILCLCQTYLGFHVLILTFIGEEPEWSCGGKNQVLRCPPFEKGECAPEYSDEFSTIVSEVVSIQFLLIPSAPAL